MPKKRLLWQLYPSYLIVVILSLFAVTWYTSDALRDLYLTYLEEKLETYAEIVENDLKKSDQPLENEWVNDVCLELSQILSSRITVILTSGKVIGETDKNPSELDNHIRRPEIQSALNTGYGKFERYSHTINKTMMYVAIPFKQNGKTIAVVRTSIPSDDIKQVLRNIYMRIVLAGLVVALVVALISLVISRSISKPIQRLKAGAERFAYGDLKSKLEIPEYEEIGSLAIAMNKMAEQLDDRIRTIIQQRNQQEAILTSMIEGVIAVDSQARLISLNQSAAEWLNVKSDHVEGRNIAEFIENKELHDFILKALSTHHPIEGEMMLEETENRFLQAHGSPLSDSEGQQIGAVIVLDDVTRIRRLEDLRRDFVANVSHELKTPVTSIKGFVETLLDGAMEVREDSQRFLTIIAKQADRLHAIIEDLLSLSRIEQSESDDAKNRIKLEKQPILPVLNSSIECCKHKAEEKGIVINAFCDDTIQAEINPHLFEQALVNLIDNAIKYSDHNSEVQIETIQTKTEIIIHVQDLGCGIDPSHLRRIFERFYRVDKARSRKMGGTGLGLAIVKHIIHAHQGYVTVESIPSEGSTFSIHLPR